MIASEDRGELRAVVLRLGGVDYPLKTRLDDGAWQRVADLVGAVFDGAPRSLPREQRLVLACLEMALAFDRIGQSLNGLPPEEPR